MVITLHGYYNPVGTRTQHYIKVSMHLDINCFTMIWIFNNLNRILNKQYIIISEFWGRRHYQLHIKPAHYINGQYGSLCMYPWELVYWSLTGKVVWSIFTPPDIQLTFMVAGNVHTYIWVSHGKVRSSWVTGKHSSGFYSYGTNIV